MGRPRKYETGAEKQRAYRQRQQQKRNGIETADVTKPNHIYCMDALVFLRNQPTGSRKLWITSPPYNLRNSTGSFWRAADEASSKWGGAKLRNGYDEHSDDMPRDEYVTWQRNCLSEMYRTLPADGAIFYNHKPRVQNGLMQSPDEIVKGLPVRQIIIWNRKAGMNFNDGYFLPTYEFIYLICKPKFKLKPGANGFSDVWTLPIEQGNDHPAPFPITLPDRILQAVETDMVGDPFMGSGTVAVAAKRHGVDYIGCDISQAYVDMANARIHADAGTRQLALAVNP
jgi:site-specific DNA-methyltransferase (adenine-specific)